MLSLTDRGALRRAIRDPALDPTVRAVLQLRFEQLGGIGADFHVVEQGDTLADAEAAIGFPLTLDDAPCWEWVERHGPVIEVVLVLSDDGPAQVLIVPDLEGVDPDLADLLRRHAPADHEPARPTPA